MTSNGKKKSTLVLAELLLCKCRTWRQLDFMDLELVEFSLVSENWGLGFLLRGSYIKQSPL